MRKSAGLGRRDGEKTSGSLGGQKISDKLWDKADTAAAALMRIHRTELLKCISRARPCRPDRSAMNARLELASNKGSYSCLGEVTGRRVRAIRSIFTGCRSNPTVPLPDHSLVRKPPRSALDRNCHALPCRGCLKPLKGDTRHFSSTTPDRDNEEVDHILLIKKSSSKLLLE